jgi:hypothetical protein
MEEMIASLVLYAVMTLIVLLSVGKIKNFKDGLTKLGIAKTNLRKEAITAIIFLGILIFVSLIIESIMFNLGFAKDLQQVPNTLKSVDFGSLLIVLSIASFVEEVFFRGYLQRKTNIIFASFIFGYFHIIYGSLSEIIGATALGFILGKEYEKTKNLFAPILSHFLFNLLTIILMVSA